MIYIYLGRKIRVNILLPLLLFLRFYSGADVLSEVFAVIIHETAHLIAGAALGLKVLSVTLSPPGADIRYEGVIPYRTEIAAALAGPFASVLFAFIFCRVSFTFFSVSLIYGLLNLLPVPCFDGGRILRGALFGSLPYRLADILCTVSYVFFLILLYLFSVFILFYTSCNASLLLICACVFVKSYIKMTK